MKKLLLLASICILTLAAPRPTQDDFNACFEKNKDSIVSVNGNYGIAITPELIAVVKNSDTAINDYVKFDPFLGLYLVKSNQNLHVPDMVDENDDTKFNKATWVATLSDSNSSIMGHVKAFGSTLGDFDELNFDVNITAQLNSACCKLVGLAIGDNKFIPVRYLKHFAAYDDVYYGDIGVSFTENETGFYVASADPLGRGKALMPKDKILSVDNTAPKGIRWLNEKVLFAPKGSILEFKILRDNEEIKLFIPVSGEIKLKDNSIDEISPKVAATLDTLTSKNTDIDAYGVSLGEILLPWGIVVDKELIVTKVIEDTPAHAFGIAKNDKILQVNNDRVKTYKDMLEKIDKQSSFLLLFTRNNFDFFARVVRER